MSAAKEQAVMTGQMPQFLTVEEVAELLRVKKRTVYEWVANNKIPFRKAGRITLFDRDEIMEWTKSGSSKNVVAVSTFSR